MKRAPKQEAAPSPLDIATANPFRYFSFDEVGEMFGLGKDVMTAIAKHPAAPVVARKINPKILLAWLQEHGTDIEKRA